MVPYEFQTSMIHACLFGLYREKRVRRISRHQFRFPGETENHGPDSE